MTLEEMREIKTQRGLSYALIAERAGLPVTTIQKVFTGETAHPRYATLQGIEKALYELGVADRSKLSYGYVEADSVGVLRETSPYMVKKYGDKTLDDYYALPDDVRVELIDGEFYDMAAPSMNHQLIAGEIHRQIANYIYDNEGSCTPYIGPRDVQLDCDNKTMVQPDVLIVCEKDKNKRRVVFGAPDFVVEVISPSNSKKDYVKKLSKYENAGVREYWIVDARKGYVIVYFFEDSDIATIYPIGADVPVRIFDGKLVIKFDRIAGWIAEERD